MIEYTPAVVFSVLLSLLLEWVPKLAEWWASLTTGKKASLNALGVALLSIAGMFYNCQVGDTCPANITQAIMDFLLVALLSLGANQGIHRTIKRENFGKSL